MTEVLFGVWGAGGGSRVRVQGSGFRVQGLGFRVYRLQAACGTPVTQIGLCFIILLNHAPSMLGGKPTSCAKSCSEGVGEAGVGGGGGGGVVGG